MKVLLVVTLLVAVGVLLSESAIIASSNSELYKESFFYKGESAILYRLLAEECPEELKSKREVVDKMAETDLRVKRLHYQELLQKLVNCQDKKRKTMTTTTTKKTTTPSTTTPPTTTKTTTTPTTTMPPTTTKTTTTPTTTIPTTTTKRTPTTSTKMSVLSPCTSAHNLTESWRRDHDGKHLRGGGSNSNIGWACDFRKDLQWFRFTGSAGKY